MMVYPRMWLLWDFVRMINGCSLSGRTVQPEYRTWGKSCTTNLIETLDCIGRLLDRGSQIEVIYLAMSKAFDNVKHAQLLSKLHIFGIGGKLFNLDLNNVRSWSTKSHCQSITRKTKPLNTAYDMMKLCWKKQVTNVILVSGFPLTQYGIRAMLGVCKQVAWVVKRFTCHIQSTDVRRSIYLTIVRPHLG